MKNLISALQFLTILPLGQPATLDPGKMIPFFPVVGLIIGILLALFDSIAMQYFSPAATGLLDLILLMLVTGGLHIDGLGDAADGLFSHKSKDKALSIMKDSRVGVMGLISILSILSLKWVGLMELESQRQIMLLIIPAYSRGSLLFGIKLFNYGRPEGGTGHLFFESPVKISNFWSLLIPFCISLFLGWRGILINIVFAGIIGAVLYFYKKKMGCITGDMLGAMVEFTESLLFFIMAAGGSS